MNCHWNGYFIKFNESFNHFYNRYISTHIFPSTFRNAENDGGLFCFCSQKNRLGKFQIINIKLTDCITFYFALFSISFIENKDILIPPFTTTLFKVENLKIFSFSTDTAILSYLISILNLSQKAIIIHLPTI